MTRFVILLRAVNVGGRSLPMAALRDAARAEGFADIQTYIQSGNIVLSSDADAEAVEGAIEAIIHRGFGLRAEAIARSAERFAAVTAANPFPDGEPKRLHLCLAKRPPDPAATVRLAERARHGERVAIGGGELWIDFAGGVGDSKLAPAVLDKAAGSTVTARNWNTVQKLVAMTKA